MIHDHRLITIEVEGDDSSVPAQTSISLGLIVTELVINCLKHAFPDGRPGRIEVGFWSKERGWLLRVRDNGIGMPQSGIGKDAMAGLGTSIVRSLAEQLQARVELDAGDPGTGVSVIHAEQDPARPEEPLMVAV
jgi:two-component system, sensor histidine kinase PdtaS